MVHVNLLRCVCEGRVCRPGRVYLARRDDGLYKLGFTRGEIRYRLKCVHTDLGGHYTPVHLISTRDPRGLERALLRALRGLNVNFHKAGPQELFRLKDAHLRVLCSTAEACCAEGGQARKLVAALKRITPPMDQFAWHARPW